MHLKLGIIYTATVISIKKNHWSQCRKPPYIRRKWMRIKHGALNCFCPESFLVGRSFRSCYEHLFTHNAYLFETRTWNLKERTFGEDGEENDKNPLRTVWKKYNFIYCLCIYNRYVYLALRLFSKEILCSVPL